jgi:hypothetical protein
MMERRSPSVAAPVFKYDCAYHVAWFKSSSVYASCMISKKRFLR